MIGGFKTFLVLVLCVLALGHPPDSTDSQNPESLLDKAFPKGVDNKQKEEILKAFESSLLNLFGLKTRPKPSNNKKIPQYMLDIYKRHTRDPESLTRNFKLKGRSVGTANTVRSFFHEADDLSLEHINGCGEENCVQLWFNVTSIPEEEELHAAELRLFIQGNDVHVPDSRKRKLMHRMEVHEIIKPKNSQTEEAFTRLLDIKHISVKNESWESLDIHPAVLKWRKTPHLNHGLEVRILPYKNHPSKTPIKHVRLRRSVTEEDHSKKHILVTYTDDNRGHRTKRSRKSKSKRKRPRRNKIKRKKYKTQCRRKPLYVDFMAVGWNDWIVAPPGYNAYYCHGDCHFPFPEHMNATNHAIVQDLVNSIDPRSVSKPCCVPTDLSPISLLYIDEYERVILKNYQDMVVQGCGCR